MTDQYALAPESRESVGAGGPGPASALPPTAAPVSPHAPSLSRALVEEQVGTAIRVVADAIDPARDDALGRWRRWATRWIDGARDYVEASRVELIVDGYRSGLLAGHVSADDPRVRLAEACARAATAAAWLVLGHRWPSEGSYTADASRNAVLALAALQRSTVGAIHRLEAL